ncbi:hypothetical protein SEA_LAHQTEMISH_26 [Microbacterium phage Lahqtemish]|uniref:hypothetical protein n=1 Tax=Microbacterium phage Lahqtemish TaxID=2776867 RepID=UPI0018A577FC|nr:hypothetical protein QDW25_gp26 [Microbacterium phage Lahqtemish]QOP66617.1 hypothetical protein SEA_LAHQTEMISH_26 [Microbacterium phage Lahqtemish]
MTEDNRIPCPSFPIALGALVGVATTYPDQTSRHAYLDSDGNPFDLVAHVLEAMGAPIRTAAAGNLDHHVIAKARAGVPGTPRSLARFPLLWNRLFLLNDARGDLEPYDGRATIFWHMADDRRAAEEYLVYGLLCHVVDPEGRGKHALLDWRGEAIRGIKSFRRFLLSPYSGFLVQTHGSHEDLLQYVDQLTLSALADLDA